MCIRDRDKAVEFLREKGLATAQKKAGRIAAEGIVYTVVSDDDKKAVVVEVNAETDFVAKNEKFRSYVADVAAQALDTTAADMDAFMAEDVYKRQPYHNASGIYWRWQYSQAGRNIPSFRGSIILSLIHI